jgi:hypothetical protein
MLDVRVRSFSRHGLVVLCNGTARIVAWVFLKVVLNAPATNVASLQLAMMANSEQERQRQNFLSHLAIPGPHDSRNINGAWSAAAISG